MLSTQPFITEALLRLEEQLQGLEHPQRHSIRRLRAQLARVEKELRLEKLDMDTANRRLLRIKYAVLALLSEGAP